MKLIFPVNKLWTCPITINSLNYFKNTIFSFNKGSTRLALALSASISTASLYALDCTSPFMDWLRLDFASHTFTNPSIVTLIHRYSTPEQFAKPSLPLSAFSAFSAVRYSLNCQPQLQT